jgi:lipopolysaccharide/colanic/teichoic acid biosynthesis glycosyltransferase/glycosyltransferase involved in cell wall biosynthesis
LSGGKPTATIIVPTLNHAATVCACLEGLANQNAGAIATEVLVVDAGSCDATLPQVEEWLAQHQPANVRLLHAGGGSLAEARNAGAQAARTALLLFIDADCTPAPDWVATMHRSFDDPEVVGVRGALRTAQSGLIPRFVQAEYDDRYDRMRGFATIDFIDNYAAAYRRDLFLGNNGFDPFFGACEDQEFSFRLAEKGYRMVFQPAAIVTRRHEAGLFAYMRRKYLQGYWKAPLTRLHPERMVQDAHTPQVLKFQIVLLSMTFGLAAASLLAFIWPMFGWLLLGAGAALAALLLSAAPFMLKLARRAPGLALVGPLMVLARSLALGAGYVAGTVHFAGALPGQRQPIIPGWKRAIKRVIDIAGALVGLAIAVPLVALAAIAIKLDSPGPIFYWQVRIGENGRPFRIAKLRSMVADAEAQLERLIDLDELSDEPAFKLVDDPRVTRIGRILRRTSLDEAPQFYNVLRGDMSLVGPRPEEARIVRLYSDYQRRRLAVKPGMTGPMQVSGRGALTFSERLALELEYIEHFSLRRDVAILLRTLPVVVLGKGAH